MNRRLENMSPGKDEDFEWDPIETTATAWSISHSRKPRRAYGRRGSTKNGEAKRRTSYRRRQFQETVLDEEGSNSAERESTSSNSSFNLKRSEIMPIPPPPGPLRHSRSASGSTLSASAPNKPPLLRHSRSMSLRSEYRRDSSSTSSSLSSVDSRLTSENVQPNISSQSEVKNAASLLSPRPPTKLKKLDMTPSDIETKGSARKKMRNRHYDNDVSESSPSFMSPNNHSFSLLAKSAEFATSWIKAPDLSPGLKNTFGFDFCLGGDVNTTSSPTYSVATTGSSSRKRGVCELPFDDAEESSLNGGQSFMSTASFETKSRSRSRIFSNNASFSKSIMSDDAPEPSDLFARSSNEDDDSQNGKADDDASSVESEDSNESTGSDAMEIEPKVQVTHNQAVAPPKPVRRSSNDFQETVFGGAEMNQSKAIDPLDPTLIFETMSDYEDLKFLIKALRKEKNGSAFASFGTTTTWTIAPPSAWDSRRRTAFLQWANRGLGFSLRAGGGTVAFLQTTVAKGGIVLESLEAALIAHKANAPPNSKVPESVAILSSMDTSRPDTKEPQVAAEAPQPVDGDVDMELLSGMESLGFAESHKEVEVTETTKATNSPLVRIVTYESGTASTSPCQQATEFLAPTIMDISESPHHAAPRLSHEHHVGGADLVLHLHGLSPNPSGGPPTLPMRRLSRPSASRPNQLRTSNIPFDEDDCWETPSVKRADQFWGSESRNGRDWGHSTRCPDDIIMILMNRLDEAFQAAGCPLGSPFDALDKIEEATPSSCFLPASVASAAVSSAALGFDGDSECEEESDIFVVEVPGDRFSIAPFVRHERTSSVGASAFSGLNLNDLTNNEDKQMRKRMSSFAKHRRVSLCAAVLPPVGSIPIRRQTTFVPHGPGSLSPRNDFQSRTLLVRPRFSSMLPTENVQSAIEVVCNDFSILSNVLSFFTEQELMLYSSLVSTTWADAATVAHASLMLTSMGFSTSLASSDTYGGGGELHEADATIVQSVSKSMERPWEYLMAQFPWACYLSDGAFKKVFKVYNSSLNASEALSVMDVENISDKTAVAAELAVSSMLSSLARRNICPNFIITRSVFTCPYEPPASHWGSSENKKPRGRSYDPRQPMGKKPRKPRADKRGTFQYIRMELCRHGDAEEYIKRLPNELMSPEESRSILFQTAFALHVAGDRFSLKHYDVKLLNIFLQDAVQGDSVDSVGDVTVLRYGLGDHVFALRMPSDCAILAKLADYGTANVQASSNGKAVTIGQFTTIENTPPDYMILGDAAQQGHGHDNFGLSLCMLHLFTGHAPYEEILEDVFCPSPLKKKLRQIWVDDEYSGFNVLRTMILPDVDGEEQDETLYHTLYRYLVLFGIPEEKDYSTKGKPVWKAITQTLVSGNQGRRAGTYGRNARQAAKEGPASAQFARDRKKYSLSHGNNKYIARARKTLEMMQGGMDLLTQLAHFDPQKRATPLDVLNSQFMASLREDPNEETHKPGENVLSFMAYSSSPKEGLRK